MQYNQSEDERTAQNGKTKKNRSDDFLAVFEFIEKEPSLRVSLLFNSATQTKTRLHKKVS